LGENTTISKLDHLKIELGSMTRPEVAQVVEARPVIVIPIGAVEQHGAHLPLDTDDFLVTEVARESVRSITKNIGRIVDSQAILCPTITVGCSEHHLTFPGTISLSHRTFIDVVGQNVRSFARHGFDTFLLLNGHGGNTPALGVAVEELAIELPSVTLATTSYWLLIQEVIARERISLSGGMGHAGEFETALSLHLRPELVDTNQMVQSIPTNPVSVCSRDLVQKGPVTMPWRVAAETPTGVIGNPDVATADAGRLYFEAAVKAVGDLIVELWSRNHTYECKP
jgi:creatinine amidohydrolase